MKKILSYVLVTAMAILLLTSCAGKSRGDFSESAIPEEDIETCVDGDVVIFGKYEQDNDPSNGKEEIEWLVIAKKGDKRLIISKYALDCQPFNAEYSEETTWETCSLRAWLNDTFLNEAFTAGERDMIIRSKVKADGNPSFGTDPGKNTTDRVFLLSIAEANRFFDTDFSRTCSPTAYAVAQGAAADPGDNGNGSETCSWLLRTPGDHPFLITYVFGDGTLNDYGIMLTSAEYAVRPAMWINVGD